MLKTDLSPFYQDVLTSLMARYPWLTPDAEILVVCGGPFDREVLQSLGFRNVTISNLDERISQSGVNPFAPYDWSYQDLENLKYEDESFDAVIVHSGLHHLRCPQRGINEMYRVARHGVIGFEPNRNFYTSLGVKLGVGQEYEDAAVYHNECRWGGVANTDVPNYVVRFNAADIRRTVQTYCPVARHQIDYFYATRVPGRVESLRSKGLAGRLTVKLAGLLSLLGRFPPFANNMAFCVLKPAIPEDLFPWLEMKDGRVGCRREYLDTKYKGA
jgi:SAM-dependent methyltransferase